MALPHMKSPLSHVLEGRPVILASRSPRRRRLLMQVGIEPEVIPSDVDENSISEDNSVDRTVLKLAIQKATVVAKGVSNGIVIGADTLVALGNEILTKPETLDEARQMLIRLSGETHDVVTGLCIVVLPEGRSVSGVTHTKVKFAELTRLEVENYIKNYEVLDKAGAYGIQDAAGLFVDRIEGSYTNVVGLPLELFRKLLFQALAD